MRFNLKAKIPVALLVLLALVPSIRAIWLEDATPVCTAVDIQSDPNMAPDGFGGVLIA